MEVPVICCEKNGVTECSVAVAAYIYIRPELLNEAHNDFDIPLCARGKKRKVGGIAVLLNQLPSALHTRCCGQFKLKKKPKTKNPRVEQKNPQIFHLFLKGKCLADVIVEHMRFFVVVGGASFWSGSHVRVCECVCNVFCATKTLQGYNQYERGAIQQNNGWGK